MNLDEQKLLAAGFAEKWSGRGYEKGDTAVFWMELLRRVFQIGNVEDYIKFERQVQLGHTSFLDAYIPAVRVLIEQKDIDVDLSRKQRQSDGTMLTPMEQAQRYVVGLRLSEHPRFLNADAVRNFAKEFNFSLSDTVEKQLKESEDQQQ